MFSGTFERCVKRLFRYLRKSILSVLTLIYSSQNKCQNKISEKSKWLKK